jgi:hypothetical protein
MNRVDLHLLERLFKKMTARELASVRRLAAKVYGWKKAVAVKTRVARN